MFHAMIAHTMLAPISMQGMLRTAPQVQGAAFNQTNLTASTATGKQFAVTAQAPRMTTQNTLTTIENTAIQNIGLLADVIILGIGISILWNAVAPRRREQ